LRSDLGVARPFVEQVVHHVQHPGRALKHCAPLAEPRTQTLASTQVQGQTFGVIDSAWRSEHGDSTRDATLRPTAP
jgi:2-polyprenyl-3-methyl-5-hydroxy-6-metoxy-1,4-benzoquinol methylase